MRNITNTCVWVTTGFVNGLVTLLTLGLPTAPAHAPEPAPPIPARSIHRQPPDRVALVTAAPPSYTRMYHYFPAHLSPHPFCYYPPAPPPPLPPLPPQPPPQQQAHAAPPTLTPLTLKQLGNSLTSMTQAAQLAKTLRYAPGNTHALSPILQNSKFIQY